MRSSTILSACTPFLISAGYIQLVSQHLSTLILGTYEHCIVSSNSRIRQTRSLMNRRPSLHVKQLAPSGLLRLSLVKTTAAICTATVWRLLSVDETERSYGVTFSTPFRNQCPSGSSHSYFGTDPSLSRTWSTPYSTSSLD